jgi:hypothetical protein
MHTYATGYLPDPAGHRVTSFHRLSARIGNITLAGAASLVARAPNPFDQGGTGACTGHAAACGLKARLGSALSFVPSPAGIYKMGVALDRFDESLPLYDQGAEPNQVVRGMAEVGVRAIGPLAPDGRYSDAAWNTDTDQPIIPEASLLELEEDATSLYVGAYLIGTTGAQRRRDIQTAVTAGFPVLAAVCALPGGPLQSYGGGVLTSLGTELDHYTCVLAFEQDGDLVLTVRNSWGVAWGENGNYRITGRAIDELGDLYVVDVRQVTT